MSDSINNQDNQSNNMNIDNEITQGQDETANDYMIALLAQKQELELSGNNIMNPQDIANFEREFRQYTQINNITSNSSNIETNNDTENDEEIARIMQENFINEQKLYSSLGNNEQRIYPGLYPTKNSNSNEINENLREYHTSEIQRQYHERYVKERLSHEYFKNKFNSREATLIRKRIRDFFTDFEQKAKNGFTDPDKQSQYIRYFLTDLSRTLIENPLWANCEKEEQENAIIEMEKLVTKRLFDITFAPKEDLAKDALLSHKIHMHSWVEPRHFNLPDFDFQIFERAGNELSNMNGYKFYIDKIICIVNCIKLIEEAYKNNIPDKEALTSEKLISILILIILKTNPKKLISNVQYIKRYVNPNLLTIGIYDYSFTNIQYSITFIEEISPKSFNITSEEYDAKIIEMTKTANEKLGESSLDTSIFNDVNRDNSSGSFLQSIVGFFTGNGSSVNEGDIPFQGFFSGLERDKSLNKNGSTLSSNSAIINEHRREIQERQLNNNIVEPMTKPLELNLTEEEQNNLLEVDKELKASLSISSNKDNNSNKDDNDDRKS